MLLVEFSNIAIHFFNYVLIQGSETLRQIDTERVYLSCNRSACLVEEDLSVHLESTILLSAAGICWRTGAASPRSYSLASLLRVLTSLRAFMHFSWANETYLGSKSLKTPFCKDTHCLEIGMEMIIYNLPRISQVCV